MSLTPLIGVRAMPFWSSESRVQDIIKNVSAYKDVQPVELELTVFKELWLSGLTKDKFNVGVNWSGKCATGYDLSPADVSKNRPYFPDSMKQSQSLFSRKVLRAYFYNFQRN